MERRRMRPGTAMDSRNPVQRLAALQQSVWLDYIDRQLLTGGVLRAAIEHDDVSGVTSNPAIFHKAIVEHGDYDVDIHRLTAAGLLPGEIYEALVLEDIRAAADALADTHRRTRGLDGFVSIEVSPNLARDTEGTYWEAERLWALVNRPNVLIKVPGTKEGMPAIQRLVARGINVNVTLLLSAERYVEAVDAYLAGLEQRLAEGEDIGGIASVASFFVSRIDTMIDERLQELKHSRAHALQGRSAIACAGLTYEKFRAMVESPRMEALARRGARPQKLLWASTGTKNPVYSAVKYVEALIAPNTVTTLPLETLAAYRQQGKPAVRIEAAVEEAPRVMSALLELGIDLGQVARQLEAEGVRKFIEPFDGSLEVIAARSRAARSA